MAKKYKPKEPVNKKMFIKLGLSIDPKDLPKQRVGKSVVHEKMEAIAKVKADAIKAIEEGS